jgi:hypothetical protein
MSDALSKFYARYGLKPKPAAPASTQKQVVRSSATIQPRKKPAPPRPRATPPAVTRREEAQLARRPAAPPPENLADFVPTSARAMPVALDPHEVAMSLPAESFLAKCERCGKDKGNDEQSRLCGRCRRSKENDRAFPGVPAVPPPALTERATLADVSAEPPRKFLKECTVVDAESGSKCKLLAPHDPYPCRNERGVIRQALQPGELPRREMAVVMAANRASGRSDIAEQTEGPPKRRGNGGDVRHHSPRAPKAAPNPGGSDGH